MSEGVAVVVLAGGQGSRIGGAKPLRTLAGERLIDRALRFARSHSDAVAVAVRDALQAKAVDADVIVDEPVEGPLGGLIAALRLARTSGRPLLLVVPADMPFLPPDLIERLRDAMGARSCAVASSGGHLHPVCGLWRAEALESATAYAESGRRSLRGLAEAVGHAIVQWPTEPADPFFNINSADDLAEAERRLAG